jgi:hypothetical protein
MDKTGRYGEDLVNKIKEGIQQNFDFLERKNVTI